MSGRKKVHTKESEAAASAPDAVPAAVVYDEHGKPLEFEDSSEYETDSEDESIHAGDEQDEDNAEMGDAMETIKQDEAASAATAPEVNRPVSFCLW